MRKWSSQLILLLLIAAPCFGQRANVTVNADEGLRRDTRPFGRYLVEICTLSRDASTPGMEPLGSDLRIAVECRPPRRALTIRKDQTITVKLVCNPAVKTPPCNLTNPKPGDEFFVAATADSGLSVRQRVLLGSVTPVGGSRTVEYRANAPGPIVIRAFTDPQVNSPLYATAAPVDLILQVTGDSTTGSTVCPVLPPPTGTMSTPVDTSTIVSLLGNPTPFILAAQGPNTIVIYSTRQRLLGDEPRILASFQDAISELAGRTAASLGVTPPPAQPFSVELKIPHANALGDLATRIGGLNYSQFTVQDVGRGRVRVTAPTQPDCDTWKGFLTDIREMTWQVISVPMSRKLFYLSSSDVATAFGSLPATTATPAAAVAPAPGVANPSSTAAPTGGSPSGGAATPGSATAAPGAASSTPSAAPSSTPSAASTAAPAGAYSTATIAITQPPGSNIQINSDTTPCVVAGLAFGNATACGGTPAATPSGANSSSGTVPGTPAAAPTPQAPLGMASVAVAAGITEQTPPDLLVYSDSNPGDDAQIEERNRVIAQLDLPRPEMILTAWVTQNSSVTPQTIGAFNNMVKSLVADYDLEFERVVLRGWESLKVQSATPNYFNEPFRSYIADRFVADTFRDTETGGSVEDLSQAFLERSQAKLTDPVYPVKRTDLRVCERGRYCLGYSDLFRPLKPALTDLLLTIIAAREPVPTADTAVAAVEGPAPPALSDASCDAHPDVRRRCHAMWHSMESNVVGPDCAEQDFRGILGSLLSEGEPRVHLQCFRQKVDNLLQPDGIGLIRAAVADFLFNYKISQQYPHEFTPYYLSHSADALNNALSPIIDAFNRDLWTYQLFVRADMQYRVERLNSTTDSRCCVKRVFGLDKPSFFNDGLVTVRTISGQSTSVSTTSQSYLNASTAPQLSALLSSLASATSPSAPVTTASPPASGSPAPIAPGNFAAISAALANYQTTYAQIGRQLSFSATPRSLNTASSAEIAVTLNADESAGGPLYTGGGTNDPAKNTSRVASHDTSTRVRVDSIKLFEISSFSAIVERSHSRFPLLPPFVEIPYIGTLVGIPLGSAKEFHSSTAIISAYVVPTAADLANGLQFVSDLVVDGLNPGPCSFFKGAAGPDVANACTFRKMLSLADVGTQTIPEFNKKITHCFATDASAQGCLSVSFDSTISIRK